MFFEGWGQINLQHAETALDGVGCKLREVEALRNDLDAVRSLKVDLLWDLLQNYGREPQNKPGLCGLHYKRSSVELGDLSLGFSI